MDGGKPVKLPSLHVRNFRMLEDFTLEKLGRVNLLVGGNNSGKSTVLEAVRVYAGNGESGLLARIAHSHDETKLEGVKPFEDFFSGRSFPEDSLKTIYIGNEDSFLELQHGYLTQEELVIERSNGQKVTTQVAVFITKDEAIHEAKKLYEAIRIMKNGVVVEGVSLDLSPSSRMFDMSDREKFPNTACSFVPTSFVYPDDLAREWDKIGLSDFVPWVRKAVRFIAPTFENIQFVKDSRFSGAQQNEMSERIGVVKTSDCSKPFPLNSMGDGVVRVLQLALKIYSAQGGFLLIDEFENGLHYSIQEKVWEMVFSLAEELDIQVFATTHSRDCISSFAAVAHRNKVTEGMLIRMGRSALKGDNNKVIGTPYTEEELAAALEMSRDVR